MSSETKNETRGSLEKDLQKRIDSAWWHEAVNRSIAGILLAFSIILSVVAGIMAALPTGEQNKIWLAVIAALPALLVSINKALKLEARADWAWERARRLEAVLRALQHEGMSTADASREYSNVEASLSREWTPYETPPQKPDSHSHDRAHKRQPTGEHDTKEDKTTS